MAKFRWTIDDGANWTVVEASLPYNISGVVATDTVIVEPIGNAVTDAAYSASDLIGAETDGVALSFSDMTAIVRDTVTPANNFVGSPNTLLTYSSPSTKWILDRDGLYKSGTTIRCEYSESGVAKGVRIEAAATALARASRRLDNATYWAATDISVGTAMGVDGVAGSASRLTASADNGTILGYANTAASAACRFAPFIKRISGSGSLEWTLDGGATWTAYAGITTAWQRLGGGQTTANPRVGFRIGTAGDVFDVDFANGETGSWDSSPIESLTTNFVRDADDIYLPATSFNLGTEVTLSSGGYLRSVVSSANGNYFVALTPDASSEANQLCIMDTNVTYGNVYTAGSLVFQTGSMASEDEYVAGVLAFAENNAQFALNGRISGVDTSCASPLASVQRLRIGRSGSSSGTRCLGGHVRDVLLLPRRMTQDQALKCSVRDSTTHPIICDGNSMTADGTYPSTVTTTLGVRFRTTNLGVGGQTTAQMQADAATQVDPYYALFGGRAHLIAWEGLNDIVVNDASLETMQTRWIAYFQARRAAGWGTGVSKLICATCIDCNAITGDRRTRLDDWNTWLRANYTTYGATHLVDLMADPRLQDASDVTYFSGDGTHPNTTGYTVIGQLFAAVIP